MTDCFKCNLTDEECLVLIGCINALKRIKLIHKESFKKFNRLSSKLIVIATNHSELKL